MNRIDLENTPYKYLVKFVFSFAITSVFLGVYVLLFIIPGVKLIWFGVALITSLVSSLIIVILPIKKIIYYVPSSILLGSIFYGLINGYLLFGSIP